MYIKVTVIQITHLLNKHLLNGQLHSFSSSFITYCKVPYLNSKVKVIFLFFQTSLCFAFIGEIFQLACSCSLNFRPHVDGYAVWLQKALHPAASLVSDHLSPYHVTRKDFVVYRFLEIDDAVIFCH